MVKTDDLLKFEVMVKETDLLVRAKKDLSRETREAVLTYRHQIEAYIAAHPEFARSLVPLDEDPYAPRIVQEMIQSSRCASVGPMAAVAGAVAEFVSKDLLELSEEVIVENGGDIYMATSRERTIGIYAGESPLSLKVGILVQAEDSPLGICTSSGTVGPSLSFGSSRRHLYSVEIRGPGGCVSHCGRKQGEDEERISNRVSKQERALKGSSAH